MSCKIKPLNREKEEVSFNIHEFDCVIVCKVLVLFVSFFYNKSISQ